MAALEAPKYPPELEEAEQLRLVDALKDWTIAHGLAIRPPPVLVDPAADPDGVLATSAPVTLFPSLFNQACFEEARRIQKPYNELYAKISSDEVYLSNIVKEVGDEFVDQLWSVHLKVKDEGYTQPLSLGLFRSDYILHKNETGGSPTPQLKQVEFNTIASSFGGLSVQTSALHRFLALSEYRHLKAFSSGTQLALPDNDSTNGLARGLSAAFNAYGNSELGYERCVIFLVQGGERNVFDQRHLEYALQNLPNKIPVFRLPFQEVILRTKVAQTPKRQLLYSLPSNPDVVFEVSVVYLRSGYGPGDYPEPSSWDARYQLERSAAIKCPTVLTQIAGTKKVQQMLAAPKTSSSPPGLARFLPEDSESFQAIWRTFTNMYPMDTSEAGQEGRRLATDAESCQRFVLKPQREGGGNNIYRAAIPKLLHSIPQTHWNAYILMELITPPPMANIILRNGRIEKEVISELGIYGTCLWNHQSHTILHNEESGYLLRTKGDKSEEGGVAAGFGCMDSCNLV